MNDFGDMTDEFNELLQIYQVGPEEDLQVVDLDAWNTGDLLRMIELAEHVLQLRGDQYVEHG